MAVCYNNNNKKFSEKVYITVANANIIGILKWLLTADHRGDNHLAEGLWRGMAVAVGNWTHNTANKNSTIVNTSQKENKQQVKFYNCQDEACNGRKKWNSLIDDSRPVMSVAATRDASAINYMTGCKPHSSVYPLIRSPPPVIVVPNVTAFTPA